MKNRRTVIIAFLLCACVAIGAGYAALTDTLTLTGDAHSTTDIAQPLFDERVYFESATEVSNTGSSTTTTANVYDVGTTDPDTAFFTIYSLAQKDEKVVIDYVIKNACEEYAVKIDVTNTENKNEEFYDMSYQFVDDKTVAQPGETLTLRVTVTMKKTPDTDVSSSFTIAMGATSQDPTPAP